jgi:RHS repeat-associated protein
MKAPAIRARGGVLLGLILLVSLLACPAGNHPPQITSTPVTTATVGQAYSYDVDATDPDSGDTLGYSLTIAPSGMSINPSSGLISWTPGAAGNFDVAVEVSDGKGRTARQPFRVTVAPPINAAPEVNAGPDQTITLLATANLNGTVTDDGLPNPPGAVTTSWSKQSGPGSVTFGNISAASTTAGFSEAGTYVLRLTAHDGALATSGEVTVTVNAAGDGGGGLPPDPATVASAIDPTVATTMGVATSFLYTGTNPIQTGVAEGTINPVRVAVIRGRVLDRQNKPLPGVTITILGHPEFGQTLSRADGRFDMAVNGGGQLILRYAKGGYLPAQRHVNAPWQDYRFAEDAVLVQQDRKLTTVDLADTTQAFQVAQGTPVTDQDGTRQSTLLIPQGTQAQVYNPDGTTRAVTSLNLRLTEYTVGANGPASMPAPLPPASAYTYAVEIKADEADTKLNGKDVVFDGPVPFYLNNFLNFPVGTIVPVGYYDNDKGVWIPSDNGKVIKILAINGGRADLDTDGDDTADDTAKLTLIGVTENERTQLAGLYTAGQTLWRVQVRHLSTWDPNWPWTWADDAVAPQNPPATVDEQQNDPCRAFASIIECENQVLRESLPVAGTGLTLNYSSDRVAGRKARNTAVIPLSGTQLPASLKRIDLQIDIAGRRVEQSLPAAPNQRYIFTWDGLDGFGRPMAGATPARIRIGYVYNPVYATPVQLTAAFGRFSGVPIEGDRTRNEVTIWQEQLTWLGALSARSQSAAGWSLSVHHGYDVPGKTLYLGTGERQSAVGSPTPTTITTVAGNGSSATPWLSGDGGLATETGLTFPYGIDVGPDGSLYIADAGIPRIRRVRPDGIITTVAGDGTPGYSGDRGPATQAKLSGPADVALAPDGSLYIADTNNNRIRRVGPDGIITPMAGDGSPGYSGDGGPAPAAKLSRPSGVTVGSDGSLYIADTDNNRIRRVGPDGIITTVAGDGHPGYTTASPQGDGGPATKAVVGAPWEVAVGPEGSLYIVDTYNHSIRRVGPDGIITTVAGKISGPGFSGAGFSGDGGLATAAALQDPRGVAVGPEGSLYIADTSNLRIRRVVPDGIITTVAGNGTPGFSGDGGAPTAASLSLPRIALGPDGSWYIADVGHSRIRRVTSTLPGFAAGDLTIPSTDGTELYRFSSYGRHLQTLNALTGAVLYQFAYNTAGLLTSVTDGDCNITTGDCNITTIERDANGNPTAIVAPFGQRTALSLDANGYLASVTNPAGEAYGMTYTADGLLTEFKDPKGNASQMTYDTLGRLNRDTDAGGGFQALARTDADRSYTVNLSTALGRTTGYLVDDLTTGDRRRMTTAPDGTQTETRLGTDGSRKTIFPDGTVANLIEGPDPRFRMLAPISKSLTITTGGLTSTLARTRTVSPAGPNNPLSLTAMTDTVTLNGRTSGRVYNAEKKTLTRTSAAGRTSKATMDNLGRVVQSQVTGLLATDLAYDPRGRLVSITQGTAPDTRSATFAYNPQGHLDTLTDPLGRILSFAYDAAGRVTRRTLPDGRQIAYAYDANGNLASLTPPGRPAHVFRYTARDQTGEYQPPPVAGTGSTLYEYDLDQDLTRVTRPDGQTLDFGYDGAGRLRTLTLPTGQLGYGYDTSTGKLTGITAQDAALAYTYNGALLTGTAWTGSVTGQVDRSYDNDFRVTSLSVNGANPIAFEYDADSLLTKAGDLALTRSGQNSLLTGMALANVTDTYAYNGFAAVTAYDAKYNTTSLLRFEYAYDKLGRVTQKKEIRGGTTVTFSYGYDTAGRLVEVKRDAVVTASYGYDSNGNRTHLNGVLVAHYDDQDRLLDYQGATYQYTANGELRTKMTGALTTTYQYDVLGNLRSVTLPDGRQIAYLIDGQNRRIGKKVNGTLTQGFLYQDSLKPIAELDGSNCVVSRFVYATHVNVPDYMIRGGVTYRIVSDHLGSPRLVIDTATASVAQRIDYDEFGNVTTDTNPGFQPFGFAGGLYDRDTKLVRFGARDYDAIMGRWMIVDPIGFAGGSTNLHAYVGNDPVNLSDPPGLQDHEEVRGTVQCDGNGGFEPHVFDPKTRADVINESIKVHERVHIADLMLHDPKACVNKKKGSSVDFEVTENRLTSEVNAYKAQHDWLREQLMKNIPGIKTKDGGMSLADQTEVENSMNNCSRQIAKYREQFLNAGTNLDLGPLR